MLFASIDLGTNTCNLSIALWGIKGLEIVHAEKQAIKLGAEGFPDGNIPASALQRIVDALLHYRAVLEEYSVQKTMLTATSGVRNANNRKDVIAHIKDKTGFDTHVISGEEEAEHIYRGVREAVPMDEVPCLLLDIGGGSNEIQIASMGKVYWRKSVDLGIARLLNRFKPSDPLKKEEILEIENYLHQKLDFLPELAEKYQINTMIGSSGSFDTFASMYIEKAGLHGTYRDTRWYGIPMESYAAIHLALITYDKEKRLAIPGMEAMRVEMIPLASVFTNFLINLFGIKQLIRSAYALKEGVIASMARNL